MSFAPPPSSDNPPRKLAPVTHLPHKNVAQAMPSLSAQQRQLLSALQAIVQPLLLARLDKLFDQAEQFFFSLLEKAENGALQTQYLSTLHALHRSSTDVKATFIIVLNQSTQAAMAQPAATPAVTARTELSLVDDAALNETLALDGVTTRAIDQCGEQWLAYHQRMQAGLQRSCSIKDTPFSPHQLAHSFLRSLESLVLDDQANLIVLKLFEKMVVDHWPQLYEQANQCLIQQGVLPNLDTRAKAPTTTEAVRTAPSAQQAPQTSTAQHAVSAEQQRQRQDYSNLPGMLAQRRQQRPQGAAPNGAYVPCAPVAGYQHAPYPGMSGYSAPPVVGSDPLAKGGAASTDTVAGQMTQVYLAAQGMALPYQLLPTAAMSLDSEQLRAWAADQAAQLQQQASQGNEADTIALVAMLFDCILDDPQLSVHMKQLMARLQLPMIKLAFDDPQFFAQGDHPARTLLNQFGQAAIAWSPTDAIEQDPLLQKMASIVNRWIKAEQVDGTVLHGWVDEFAQFIQAEQQQQALHEQRLLQSEHSLLHNQRCREQAEVFIQGVLELGSTPKYVRELLHKHWYRLIYMLRLQKQDQSQILASQRIAEELVWSVQPLAAREHCQRFNEVVPRMLQGLRQGLTVLKMPAQQINTVLATLNQIHQACFSKQADPDVCAPPKHFHQPVQRLQREVLPAVKVKVDEPALNESLTSLEDWVAQVRGLTLGSWYELETATDPHKRVKLADILGEGEKYLFTDRQGNKIAERSLMGLAMAFKQHKINPITQTALVDKALQHIETKLAAA